MGPMHDFGAMLTRRHFFRQGAMGLGAAALATLLPRAGAAELLATGGLSGLPHFAPKAKRAIYLFTNGGPSQMDMFDYKPKMQALFDKDLPVAI